VASYGVWPRALSDDCPEESVKDKHSTASSGLIKIQLSKSSKSRTEKKSKPDEEKTDSEDEEDVLLRRDHERSR